MVSKLDRIPSLARAPSLREPPGSDDSANRETIHSDPDPDLRVTLSTAALRLSEPPQATARSTPPAHSADAYREPHRPAVGGRLSIRI